MIRGPRHCGKTRQERSIQDISFFGGWPELYARNYSSPKEYLDDYIDSYVEKDIVLSAGIQKIREFRKFLSLLAGRVGQLLDIYSLASASEVDSKTIKNWISILETMQLICLVEPYFSNRTNRLVKSPKVYFIDTGLACRLQGWEESLPLLNSPAQGALFENLVFSEIYKFCTYELKDLKIFHWRSKDKEEIDFLIEKQPGEVLLI